MELRAKILRISELVDALEKSAHDSQVSNAASIVKKECLNALIDFMVNQCGEDDLALTYRDLLNWLQGMSNEELDCNVSILDNAENEFYSLKGFAANMEDENSDDFFDELAPGHPYLMF